MKLNIKYIESIIEFEDGIINCIEIENKTFLYRVINDLNYLSNGDYVENIVFSDDSLKECNMLGKISIICDYFNFDFNSKKTLSILNKKISDDTNLEDKVELAKLYNKIVKKFMPTINELDLNLTIENEFNVESFVKLLNITINKKDNLLDNLFMLIDIEKILNINKIIVFVNLKQYLSKAELLEFYKYSLYNSVVILLIDSISYGVANKYEKKLIIDKELEEFKI